MREFSKKIVHLDDEELTTGRLAEKTRDTLQIIDKIQQLYLTGLKQAAQLQNTAKSNSRVIARPESVNANPSCNIPAGPLVHFNEHEKKRLIDIMRHTVEQVHSWSARLAG